MADKIVGQPGVMERQQLGGGLHDRLSNQRQRESGSSRGQVDLTLIRSEEERPAGLETASIESGDPGIPKKTENRREEIAPSPIPTAVANDPKTGGAGPVDTSVPAGEEKDTKGAPRRPTGSPEGRG